MEKKLYKSSNNKVFAVRCGGIGEYFDRPGYNSTLVLHLS